MGFFDEIGGLGTGMLGLGVAGDVFSAYSQQQAQQRQRNLYNQYQQQQQQLQNPAYMLSQAQPYYQQNLATMQSALPSIMRQTVNPMLGQQGLDPAGGAAQSILQQTIAQQQQQAWQQAQQQAYQNQSAGLTGLGGATQNVGQPTGTMGGTSGALQALMMQQALARYHNPQQQTQQQQTNPYGTTSNLSTGFDTLKSGSPLTMTGQEGWL